MELDVRLDSKKMAITVSFTANRAFTNPKSALLDFAIQHGTRRLVS